MSDFVRDCCILFGSMSKTKKSITTTRSKVSKRSLWVNELFLHRLKIFDYFKWQNDQCQHVLYGQRYKRFHSDPDIRPSVKGSKVKRSFSLNRHLQTLLLFDSLVWFWPKTEVIELYRAKSLNKFGFVASGVHWWEKENKSSHRPGQRSAKGHYGSMTFIFRVMATFTWYASYPVSQIHHTLSK